MKKICQQKICEVLLLVLVAQTHWPACMYARALVMACKVTLENLQQYATATK